MARASHGVEQANLAKRSMQNPDGWRQKPQECREVVEEAEGKEEQEQGQEEKQENQTGYLEHNASAGGRSLKVRHGVPNLGTQPFVEVRRRI